MSQQYANDSQRQANDSQQAYSWEANPTRHQGNQSIYCIVYFVPLTQDEWDNVKRIVAPAEAKGKAYLARVRIGPNRVNPLVIVDKMSKEYRELPRDKIDSEYSGPTTYSV